MHVRAVGWRGCPREAVTALGPGPPGPGSPLEKESPSGLEMALLGCSGAWSRNCPRCPLGPGHGAGRAAEAPRSLHVASSVGPPQLYIWGSSYAGRVLKCCGGPRSAQVVYLGEASSHRNGEARGRVPSLE